MVDLNKDWHREIEIIRKCVDCYHLWMSSEEDKDFFTKVCTKPHLLVFVKEAKGKDQRMWPAKVTIDCFCDHLGAEYLLDECLLYSDKLMESVEKSHKYSKSTKIGKQEAYKRSFVVSKSSSPKKVRILYCLQFLGMQ